MILILCVSGRINLSISAGPRQRRARPDTICLDINPTPRLAYAAVSLMNLPLGYFYHRFRAGMSLRCRLSFVLFCVTVAFSDGAFASTRKIIFDTDPGSDDA